MGRPPCCDKSNVKRGPWTAEEDAKILAYISTHGIGNWTLVPKKAGLNRCGKSCRLRWTNYLRPDLKHDSFTPQEEELIINLHQAIGSRWSLIAKRLPGRTDNDVKNYWNTKLKKKLIKMGIDPITHKPLSQILSEYGNISSMSSTTALMCSKPDLSSVFPGSSTSFGMVANPKPEHVQDNSSITNSLSWEFLAQFQATNLDNNMQQQPHFLAEVSPSCSSSSSTAFFSLSSPQSRSCQESQAHRSVPSSPFKWSELLSSDPLLVEDHVQQQDGKHDIHGMLSSSNTSTLTQADEITQCKFPSADELQILGTVEHGAIDGSHGINSTGASSSSASSFVDVILDMDREMSSRFPQLMDPSFDYC